MNSHILGSMLHDIAHPGRNNMEGTSILCTHSYGLVLTDIEHILIDVGSSAASSPLSSDTVASVIAPQSLESNPPFVSTEASANTEAIDTKAKLRTLLSLFVVKPFLVPSHPYSIGTVLFDSWLRFGQSIVYYMLARSQGGTSYSLPRLAAFHLPFCELNTVRSFF